MSPSLSVLLGARPFGEYQLIAEIARGGMGVVFRARQMALNRIVALKMILAGRLATSDDVQRFRIEAEAAAKLHHPNIVAVYHVAEYENQHFFTMEFIQGSSLDRRLTDGPLTGRAAARYVRILARAVHYAHEQGILHRDLKPSNVLIDERDEPHITDFGLAKEIGTTASSGRTDPGCVLGTPSYMAPEQAQGKSELLGPACDIYSLGAILYELLTGWPPFHAETPLATVKQVVENDPMPPRLHNANVDHDLETICLKCLEKDPKRRYESAEALGDDLQRHLDGEAISAHSYSVLDRLTRMLDRSQHVETFSTWSNMVLIMAGIIGMEHLLVYGLLHRGLPTIYVSATRLMHLILLGLVFGYYRRTRLLPTNPPERQLWTLWVGYLISYIAILLTTRLLLRRAVLNIGDHAPDRLTELLPYPFLSIVAGVCFFIMGSSYWGRCYVFGAAFFALAALMALRLDIAPLGYGLLWSGALAALGLHLRRQASATPSPLPSSQEATAIFPPKS